MPVQSGVGLGPYSLNSIVPPGEDPPDKVAASIGAEPGGPPALGVVVIVGDTLAMVTFSSPQLLATGLFLVSPL